MNWNNFENSMQNEGGFMDNSISAGGEDKSNFKRGQNVIPVVIAQLLRHGEELSVWGFQAKLITFVGIVRNIEQLTTKVTFDMEDDTGNINVMKWLEAEQTVYEPLVKVDQYARVHGMIRKNNNETYVLAVNIKPLKSMGELVSHLMEVTYVSLKSEKMSKVEVDHSTSNNTMPVASNSNALGMNNEQSMVLDIIKKFSDDESGAERCQIKELVPGHIKSKVDDILDFLSSEGHIYTTRTDDFFKSI